MNRRGAWKIGRKIRISRPVDVRRLSERRGLALDPGVSRVEEGRELERAGHRVDVLDVEDEELVAAEERPVARRRRPGPALSSG